jgi:ribosomal protein S27AE
LELQQLACPRCNYTANLLVGTLDVEQTFSDLNEDFAYYKLFLCPEGNDINSIDINFREFDGNCPQHKVELRPLTNSPETCPRCGGPFQVTRKGILKPERGE